MNKIKIDFLAQPTLGINQSGMKTQIDTLYEYFLNDRDIIIKKYDMWNRNIPNIVHYFGMGEGMLQVLRFLKANGSKIICSPNHWPVNNKVEKLLMSINFKNIIYSNRITKKYLIDNADLFIVNSEAEKKMFKTNFGISNDRITVIYNSYGDEPVSKEFPKFTEKYNITEPFALMAGQIGSKRKNQLPVIKSWKEDYPNLYILGGYEKTSYGIECMEELNKKGNVFYLGYEIDSLILESAYQNCELFISPGLIETPSLSAFRALMNGAKVCSTNFGGAPNEYFGNNVKYFNPYNEEEIAESINQALKFEKWDIDYENLKQFSNTSISEEYKKIYLNFE